MRKYTKPSVEIVELSVKESLSALPTGFSNLKRISSQNNTYKNVTIYTATSAAVTHKG